MCSAPCLLALRRTAIAPRLAISPCSQSQDAGERVGGGTRGRIALLALMAAYRQGREQLQLALRVVRLLAALPPTGRFDIVKLFVTYLLQTQDEAHLPRLSEEWRRRAPEAGGDFVTIAEMLFRQGRQEGRQEGRLETLEPSGALRGGMAAHRGGRRQRSRHAASAQGAVGHGTDQRSRRRGRPVGIAPLTSRLQPATGDPRRCEREPLGSSPDGSTPTALPPRPGLRRRTASTSAASNSR